jgi:hypothetical protein
MDEIVGIRLFAGLVHHLLDVAVSFILEIESVQDVILDCTAEQYWLLLH